MVVPLRGEHVGVRTRGAGPIARAQRSFLPVARGVVPSLENGGVGSGGEERECGERQQLHAGSVAPSSSRSSASSTTSGSCEATTTAAPHSRASRESSDATRERVRLVEPRRGLVGDQDVRPRREGTCDRNAEALAAGEPLDALLRTLGEPDGVERRQRSVPRGGRGAADPARRSRARSGRGSARAAARCTRRAGGEEPRVQLDRATQRRCPAARPSPSREARGPRRGRAGSSCRSPRGR